MKELSARRAWVSSKALRAAALFMAKKDVRYYLKGVFIQPHISGKGVMVVATNGHVMMAVYDPTGYSNGEWICELPPTLLAAAKRCKPVLAHNAKNVLFSGHWAGVIERELYDPEQYGELIRYGLLHFEAARVIDGTFPSYLRIISGLKFGSEPTSINPEYLALLDKVSAEFGKPKYGCAWKLYTDAQMSCVAMSKFQDFECFAVIIPMRDDDRFNGMPEWLAAEIAAAPVKALFGAFAP